MNKSIAVVGCGYWGKNLVRNFYELGALKYIVDQDVELVSKIQQEIDIESTDFDTVLNDKAINGVVLAVPAVMHANMAIQAMNAKKNVFVEKPLAMSVIEGREMIDSSKKNNVNLMVGHLLRYHPAFIELKSMLDEGKIGDVCHIFSSRMSLGKVRSEEDVIWSFAPHDISMILSIIGKNPQSIFVHDAKVLQKNISDIAVIDLDFPNNIKAQVSVSWLHPYKEQKLVVIGKEGMMVFDDTESWDRKLSIYPHRIEFQENQFIAKKKEPVYVSLPESEPLKLECKHFIDLLSGKTETITDGEEGLMVLQVLNACSDSLKHNKEVSLDS